MPAPDANPASAPQALYVDDALLVLNKPAGLLSVPGRGADKQDCLATRTQAHWHDALVVHRLDMATSGLMLMARSKSVQSALSQAFASRQIGKRYVAVVMGALAAPPTPWGLIELPIALDWPNRPLSRVDHTHGKPSLTRWRVQPPNPAWLDWLAPQAAAAAASVTVTHLELEPLTGRSHQLRVHLQAMGHPIVGDTLYGDEVSAGLTTRLLLHAWRLGFAHPVTQAPMAFSAPLPF